MFSICDNTATKQLLAKQISVLETYFIGQPTLTFEGGSWGRNCFVYLKNGILFSIFLFQECIPMHSCNILLKFSEVLLMTETWYKMSPYRQYYTLLTSADKSGLGIWSLVFLSNPLFFVKKIKSQPSIFFKDWWDWFALFDLFQRSTRVIWSHSIFLKDWWEQFDHRRSFSKIEGAWTPPGTWGSQCPLPGSLHVSKHASDCSWQVKEFYCPP